MTSIIQPGRMSTVRFADLIYPTIDQWLFLTSQVIILNKNEPDLEFEGLLKREKIRVKYFQVNFRIGQKKSGKSIYFAVSLSKKLNLSN